MTAMGMFCAVSYIAVLIGKLVPNVAGFLSYDPKDAIVAIVGFILGPVSCLVVSVIVSFIEMITISSTGPYGMIMNIVSTSAFAMPAAWFYRKHHTRNGALWGLAIGTASMAVCMLIWNYAVTPFYMGVERSVVAAMLMSVFLPFNLVKGGINAGITLLIYAPIVNALRKTKLVPPSGSTGKKKFNVGYTVFALAVIITFGLLLLVLAGII